MERLRAAARGCDWVLMSKIAASLSESSEADKGGDALTSPEVAYAVAYAPIISGDEHAEAEAALRCLCLALVAADEGEYRPFLMAADKIKLIGWALARIVIDCPLQPYENGVPDEVSKALPVLLAASDRDAAYQWFVDVFVAASNIPHAAQDGMDGNVILADAIWEGLTGASDVGQARADLLSLLHRSRQYNPLRRLIRHASQQRQAEIRACLETLLRSDAERELRPMASQRFFALRSRAHKQSNTKPWVLFFEHLLSLNEHLDPPLECSLESALAIDEEDNGMIEVKLTPSINDPPQFLVLELASGTVKNLGRVILLAEDDIPLIAPRVVPVTIPRALLQDAAGIARIAYRITGKTNLNRPVDIRDKWDLQVNRQRLELISDDLMQRCWPGAEGDPVRTRMGFHGREGDSKRIESCLLDHNRPRSIMLFGQRRIGKTSLLCEMVTNLPPVSGHICGVYVNVQGLAIPDTRGSMPSALFTSILSAIESKAENVAVLRAVEQATGISWRRLTRDLDASVSFADALEQLVKRLDQYTKGTIKRVAFFFDEFDRFVQPMLCGRAEEVDRLMWVLREIVQQSQSIALVFAGSGLQRVFTDEYKSAFYGSIAEHELGEFSLPNDRQAVMDTFLPTAVRDRLCPSESRDAVIAHAHALCGGHPYYLAMLGYASASMSRGHPLTPALLNRVVEGMVRGAIRGKISSTKFYGHIFESLKLLPRQHQAIAKIILAHVAELTTPEHEWLAKVEAIDAPELTGTDQGIRFELMRALVNEHVLDLDDRNKAVRIRVPVTAAALREDVDRIREEATLSLQIPTEVAQS